MVHVMVDLETMGTGKQAAFVQIGAVKFTPFGAPLPEQPEPAAPTVFYRNVTLDSAVRLGLKMDVSTINWWLHNAPNAARESLRVPEPQPAQKVLQELKRFVNWNEDYVWAKGPGFDLAILSEAYRMMGDRYGLCNFAHERCVRTVLDWGKVPVEFERQGVEHNALADAWHQARCVQMAARQLGLSEMMI